MRGKKAVLLCFLALVCAACSKSVQIPADAVKVSEPLLLYPDYKDVVVPPNIAPLNVMVQNEGEEFVVLIAGTAGDSVLAGAGKDGKLQFEQEKWHSLLNRNAGSSLMVTIYAHRKDTWVQLPSYEITVAPEEIDSFLSYRLIEPGYEIFYQMGLYQRNLTDFEEIPIYENHAEDHNHCVNCHNYQQNTGQNMLFHVRGAHGGTVFVQNGIADKRIMTHDSILGNAVYPSWHPTKPWVVFSSNMTSQIFHLRDNQKAEVIDSGSDLIFYDAEHHTVSNILKTNAELESFPCWTPDGKSIYYGSARLEALDSVNVKDTRTREHIVQANYQNMHYNLMRLDFDETTQTFGTPQLVLDCAREGVSASFPKVSPDGRYVLFTLGQFGQFHIWHKSSDLYVLDVQTQEVRPLVQANSADVDSYHCWSSNGRWIVFSSRRDDGSYTRPYIAYFDKDGKDHKAFLLPQEDPEQNLMRLKSYNVPELTRDRVRVTEAQLRDVILADEKARKVSFKTAGK